MITEDMIRRGLASGIVEIVESPHQDGAVCQIGENWFYFVEYNSVNQEMTVDELKSTYNTDELAHLIWTAIDALRHETIFVDDTDYFETVLKEAGIGG